MLSATPVQVHSDNLYTLLHLLRPELFPDKDVFAEVLEPNRYITEAVRLLRAASLSAMTGSALRRQPSAKLARRAGGEGSCSRTPGTRHFWPASVATSCTTRGGCRASEIWKSCTRLRT